MAGHSRLRDGVASTRLCPAIHVFVAAEKSRTWMPGSSPGMTTTIDSLPRRPTLGAGLRHWRGRAHRYVPDLLGIFANGAVGGEPRHSRDIEDRGASPGRHHLPAGVDAALGGVIGIEIGRDHIVVEVAQRVADGSEAGGIVGRERA